MNNFLLPYKFKLFGVTLVIIGLIGFAFYLWFDFRLMLPVFAVFSSFFETKFFTIFRTNIADELIMLFILSGLFCMVFSKEKKENDNIEKIRTRAFSMAILANVGFLFLSILFIYGNAFITVLLVNLFSLFFLYMIFFLFLKWKGIK
jgi:hypothetical protein